MSEQEESGNTEDSVTPSDELKRKFKEALEKKNAKHREGEAHLDGDSSVHPTQGPRMRREFRRKSG